VIRIHDFPDSGEALSESYANDSIDQGDLLRVSSEGLIAVVTHEGPPVVVVASEVPSGYHVAVPGAPVPDRFTKSVRMAWELSDQPWSRDPGEG
jgi:hypothetical protein